MCPFSSEKHDNLRLILKKVTAKIFTALYAITVYLIISSKNLIQIVADNPKFSN